MFPLRAFIGLTHWTKLNDLWQIVFLTHILEHIAPFSLASDEIIAYKT